MKLLGLSPPILILLGLGVWSVIGGILFVKKKENRNALPLALLAIYTALSSMFFGFGVIASTTLELGVEGGPLQGLGYLWLFVSLVVFSVLGIWATIKGIILIKSKENVKLGTASLVVGATVAIPSLLFLLYLLIILLSMAINGPRVLNPVST